MAISPMFLRDGFGALLQKQKAREMERYHELSELVAVIPVADELLQEIAWIGGSHQATVLQKHPGEPINRKLVSLWSMLDVFQQAQVDLRLQLDRFHAFSLTPDMGTRRGRQLLVQIETAIKKELMTYSVAASGLVAHSRRVNAAVPLASFDSRRQVIFDVNEHSFIMGLRNLIAHEEFPSVSWQIHHGRTRETDFVMPSSSLLLSQQLNADAKHFIERSGEKIYVSQVVESYSARVGTFYAWYKKVLEQEPPPALADYRRVANCCRVVASRNSYRLFVHHWVSAKVDPYKHLDRYLLPEQLDAALGMVHRSKAQVDFIIATADEHGACDDELRTMIYRLFQVPGFESSK